MKPEVFCDFIASVTASAIMFLLLSGQNIKPSSRQHIEKPVARE